MITNIHKNIMGTTSFDGKFSGMRKEQEFIVYPINNENPTALTIQSDTRFGYIEISSGVCNLSSSHAGGAYAFHFMKDCYTQKNKQDNIPYEEMMALYNFIRGTSNPMAGNNGMNVYCDNGKAHTI